MAGKAYLVVDLGFGDQGKGATTSALVRQTQSKLVVRFNGGAQAAHHVVHSPGLEHTFHQFGSGTFEGAATFLSKFVIFNPIALLYEARELTNLGISDPMSLISIDSECLVSTPFHSVINRMRASLDNTGTCGMGIGETISHSLAKPDHVIRYKHLFDETSLKGRLDGIRYWAREQYKSLLMKGMDINGEHPIPVTVIKQAKQVLFEDAEFDATVQIFTDIAKRVGQTNPYFLKSALRAGDVVFEGAQGILLDQDYGFHPHTTWSKCTTENARTLLSEAGHTDITSLGLIRAYQTRHGFGPMPTEQISLGLSEPTNPHNEWQGGFRIGTLDGILTEYAVRVSGGIDGLVVNHLDVLDTLPQNEKAIVTSYKDQLGFKYVYLPKLPVSDLEVRSRLTNVLKGMKPCGRVRFSLDTLEDITKTGIFMEGWGPLTSDKKFC